MKVDIIDNRLSWLNRRPNETLLPEIIFGTLFFLLFVTTGFVKLWMIGLVGLFYFNVSIRHIYFKPEYLFQTSIVWIFLLYTCATYYWSVDKTRTFDAVEVQLIVFFVTFLIAIFMVQRNWLSALAYAFIGIIVYNYFYIALNPSYALTPIGLRGSFYHKNGFGSVLALATMVFYFAKDFPLRKYLLLLSVFTLLLTQSKTSMLLLALSLILTHLMARMKSSVMLKFLKLTILMIGISFIVALSFYSQILNVFIGSLSPTSFTGRGLIWISLLSHFESAWFQGLGLGTLWTNKNFDLLTTTQFYWENPEWADKLTGADSGYVDAILMIGFVGLVVFLSVYVLALYRLIPLLGERQNGLIFSFLIYLGFHNLTESTLLLSANGNWFVLVFSLFYAFLAVSHREENLKLRMHHD
jgi:O-antigen ligase